MTAELTPGLPKKVLRKAAEYGTHSDCIAADYRGACEGCRAHVMLALNYFYGEFETHEEVVRQIIADILGEL